MKRRTIKICKSWENEGKRIGARQLIASGKIKRITEMGEDIVACELLQTSLVFTKPTFVGMSVLELAKEHMYSFHYDVMVKKFEKNLRLCYHDTGEYY